MSFYNTIIGEKRAQEIMKYALKELKSQNQDINLPAMEAFIQDGVSAGKLLEAYDEFNEHTNNGANTNSIRFPYDDTGRIRKFVAGFIPSKEQLDTLKQYGIERIEKYTGKL